MANPAAKPFSWLASALEERLAGWFAGKAVQIGPAAG